MKESSRIRSSQRGSFIVDRHGSILGFDQAMEELTGWKAVDVVARTTDGPPSPGSDDSGSAWTLYCGRIPVVDDQRSLELTLSCRNGRRLETEAVVHRLGGPGDRMHVTVLRVMTLQSGADSGGAAHRDTLTGLQDRESFEQRLSEAFDCAVKSATPLALILADVDHLRETNTRLGREAGDEILQKLAGILRVAVDDETRLCRLQEDDFAILLPNAGRGEARQVAAGLRSTVARHRFLSGTGSSDTKEITLSIGAASFPADAETWEDLVDRAKDALNEARSMGRDRVWCYLRRSRVPVQVPVYFEGPESLLLGYTRDLSPSGVFVQTSAPIDIGMRCALTFPIPGVEDPVHVIGRVVRTVPPETSDEVQELRIPGMGMEFERFGGSVDRRAIESFLHHNESTTLRPEGAIFSA